MFETIRAVGETFQIFEKLYSFDSINQGNINSTYKVTYQKADGGFQTYLFQRVNTVVFKDPVKIMKNIERVTEFIRKNNPGQPSLHFYHTKSGEIYHVAEDNCFWRVTNYIDSITFDSTDDLAVIESTGEAFGNFQMQLAELDGSVLYETIPDFHNTQKRLDTLFADAVKDPCGRVAEVREELEYIQSVRALASELSVRFAKGEIPTRVTHNDTKANNVLFDRKTRRPLVVIDLDTIMPGMAMYDFGDAVRFIANTAEEDEKDLSCVYFDTAKFRAFCNGFIGKVKHSLTRDEIDNLVLASFSITVELAARFLDDYIVGDTYFKCKYPGHNLVRTRCQLKLAKDIMNKFDELNWIVRDVVEHS